MIRNFDHLQGGPFDLIVIGGGINGAWVAYDAALRGLSVALIEKGDWACKTSSCSSKLIHGGLRYLEQFDIHLVKKSLCERKRLLRLAPHRVYPLRFHLPIYSDSKHNRLTVKSGLWLYDWLGKNTKEERHHYHSKKIIEQKYSFLVSENLKGSFSYLDCQTDDARFTLEIVSGALSAGAAAVNYCEATELIQEKRRICGVRVKDLVGGETLEIRAKTVVNVTGADTAHLFEDENIVSKKACLTKGIHLVMPSLQTNDAFLFTAKKDQRIFFCIPWYERTLIGTTDTFIDTARNTPTPDVADISYLLDEANYYLKQKWQRRDICGSFAGIRVLQKNVSGDPSSLSREWALHSPLNGLFVPVGGKFTTARLEADQSVTAVMNCLGLPPVSCETGERPFPWSPDEDFSEWNKKIFKQGSRLGLDSEIINSCGKRQGKNIGKLFSLIRENSTLKERIDPEFPFIKAEIVYAVSDEMAITLDDIIRRRIPLSILGKVDKRITESIAMLTG